MFSRSAGIYDAVYGFKDYAAEAAQVDSVIRSHSPEARALLDVACGTGLHLEHLSARYRCAGPDLDPTLLEVAARRAEGGAHGHRRN